MQLKTEQLVENICTEDESAQRFCLPIKIEELIIQVQSKYYKCKRGRRKTREANQFLLPNMLTGSCFHPPHQKRQHPDSNPRHLHHNATIRQQQTSGEGTALTLWQPCFLNRLHFNYYYFYYWKFFFSYYPLSLYSLRKYKVFFISLHHRSI